MATDKKKNYKLKLLKKYPNGGKVKPIIVTDPNDPRLKAYNDSNELYNKSRVSVRKLIDRGYTPSTRFHDGENWDKNPNLLPSRGIKPLSNLFFDLTAENYIKYKSKGELNPTDREVYGGFKGDLGEDEKGKMSGLQKVGVGKFPKPVQPVVYQKPVDKPKPVTTKPLPPIVVTDPKDPRLKAYNDSLNLYNASKNKLKKLKLTEKDTPVYLKKGVSPDLINQKDYDFVNYQGYNTSGRFEGNMNPNNNFPPPKVKQKILPIAGIGVNTGNSMGGWYNIYKKPVQPVVYQKPVAKKVEETINIDPRGKGKGYGKLDPNVEYEQIGASLYRPITKPKFKPKAKPVPVDTATTPIVQPVTKPTQQPTKPLPFKAKYNMPDTSATPNMQGEYPLRTFYQGTNTQREADSIEDVKGLERIKLQEYMRNNPKKKKFGGKIKYAPGGTVSNTLPTGSDPSDPMGLLTTAGGAAVPGLNIATTLVPMAIASAERNYSKMRDKIGANNTIQASDMTDYAQFLDPMTLDTVNNLPDFAKRDPRYKSRIDTQAKTAFVNQQPITRVDTGSEYLFPDGGMMPEANAELEKQEVFQTPDGTVGNVDGPSHSNGGVDVSLPPGTKIWSDRLKSGNKTFAQKAKVITNKINRLEKLPNRKYDRTIESTLNIFNGQLDGLFVEQESLKEAMGVDDSGNTFSRGGTMKYPSRGTFDPFEDIITYQDQDIDNPVDPVDNSNFRFYEYDRTGKNQYSVPPVDDPDRVYDPIPGQVPNNFPQRNNAINILEDEPTKPLNMKRSNGLEMPKVPVNERDVLPYIGPANLFMSSFQKDPVNRIRNKMAGPAMADMVAAEQMMPTRFDITPQLGEVKSADRSFRKAVGERTTGSNTAAILNASKANNLRLKANLYGEKFNKENSMDMARAEVRSNIGRFRASLGAEDANYERQYNVDKLQDSAGRRGMRNSAISNLASNKMQNTNDKMKIKLLKDIFPNADLSQALKTLELFNTEG